MTRCTNSDAPGERSENNDPTPENGSIPLVLSYEVEQRAIAHASCDGVILPSQLRSDF